MHIFFSSNRRFALILLKMGSVGLYFANARRDPYSPYTEIDFNTANDRFFANLMVSRIIHGSILQTQQRVSAPEGWSTAGANSQAQLDRDGAVVTERKA